jgi:uric acid transporter
VVAAVPNPVLGGAGVVLFGSVAASGIRTLSKVNNDGTLNLVIVSVAVAFGVIPIAVPEFYDAFPEWVGQVLHSGISAASIVAVLLNLLFNEFTGGRKPAPSVLTAGPAVMVRENESDVLAHGGSFEAGTPSGVHDDDVSARHRP